VLKKTAGYLLFALVIVAVLVLGYVVVTKGYLSKGINLSQISTTQTENPTDGTATPAGTTTGNVTSTKISLVITSPVNGAILDSTNVTVKGKTTPKADVFVNDQEGVADANGNFSISIGLDEGNNLITVSANDADGNVSQQDLNVTVVSFE
jgi:large repetitive protein